jgi:hypothetical protein
MLTRPDISARVFSCSTTHSFFLEYAQLNQVLVGPLSHTRRFTSTYYSIQACIKEGRLLCAEQRAALKVSRLVLVPAVFLV